jgi:TolB-like protein
MCQNRFVILILLVTSFVLFSLSGCSRRYDDMPTYLPFSISFDDSYENRSVGRFKTSFLAEQIDHYYRGVNPGPIGVTTFVNLDDLNNTSSFGRMVGEQLMSELAMRGYDVIELRHADALQFVSSRGEFGLSRDLGAVRSERQLGGIVVGTYVASPVRVYLNARLVNPTTSLIVSAGSVEMEKTAELVRLLRGGSSMPALERIPVRHIGRNSYPILAYQGDALENDDFRVAPYPKNLEANSAATRTLPKLPEAPTPPANNKSAAKK